MNKINYQKKCDEIININLKNKKTPKLLLHSCCAPCSSYVLKYISQYFNVTVFYYNPNIFPYSEYLKRLNEQKKIIDKLELGKYVELIEGRYDTDKFYKKFIGFEKEKEGGKRCEICYYYRLLETCKLAKTKNFDYFSTTLTVSPHKNSDMVNNLGQKLGEEYKVNYLYSDFKKNEGYKQSVELAKKYDLYMQNYCGCVYSKENK